MIYQYSGCDCRDSFDRVCSLAQYEADPSYCCPECGKLLTRVISAPRLFLRAGQFEPFRSTVDGSVISSHRELQEHNKRNGVVNLHDGYDDKAVMEATKKNYQKPLDDERRKDLDVDIEKSVQKLVEGYKPSVAPEGDIA